MLSPIVSQFLTRLWVCLSTYHNEFDSPNSKHVSFDRIFCSRITTKKRINKRHNRSRNKSEFCYYVTILWMCLLVVIFLRMHLKYNDLLRVASFLLQIYNTTNVILLKWLSVYYIVYSDSVIISSCKIKHSYIISNILVTSTFSILLKKTSGI